MHVGHMASHVCDHGMPCVNMHGTVKGYKYGVVRRRGEQQEGK